jgi:hypothetical protein
VLHDCVEHAPTAARTFAELPPPRGPGGAIQRVPARLEDLDQRFVVLLLNWRAVIRRLDAAQRAHVRAGVALHPLADLELLDRGGRLEAQALHDPGVARRIVEQRLDCLRLIPPAAAPPRPLQRPREGAPLANFQIDVDASILLVCLDDRRPRAQLLVLARYPEADGFHAGFGARADAQLVRMADTDHFSDAASPPLTAQTAA